jgi:hypothetical protein
MCRIWKPHAFPSFKPYAAYIFPTFDAQQHISEAMDRPRTHVTAALDQNKSAGKDNGTGANHCQICDMDPTDGERYREMATV